MTTTAPVISRTSASSQCPERVPAYRVYAQLTSTSALQRGMLSYIAFKHRRRHRLEDNSVTCATPHCSSSTEAYQPRTNALKSVVDSTTALLCLQPMSVAVNKAACCKSPCDLRKKPFGLLANRSPSATKRLTSNDGLQFAMRS